MWTFSTQFGICKCFVHFLSIFSGYVKWCYCDKELWLHMPSRNIHFLISCSIAILPVIIKHLIHLLLDLFFTSALFWPKSNCLISLDLKSEYVNSATLIHCSDSWMSLYLCHGVNVIIGHFRAGLKLLDFSVTCMQYQVFFGGACIITTTFILVLLDGNNNHDISF